MVNVLSVTRQPTEGRCGRFQKESMCHDPWKKIRTTTGKRRCHSLKKNKIIRSFLSCWSLLCGLDLCSSCSCFCPPHSLFFVFRSQRGGRLTFASGDDSRDRMPVTSGTVDQHQETFTWDYVSTVVENRVQEFKMLTYIAFFIFSHEILQSLLSTRTTRDLESLVK